MNPHVHSFLATVAAVSGLGAHALIAQTAPALAPKEQEAVKLDPFNVSADSDVGFVAASSLAGGRMATALKDTPVAYSVITKEFLDAFNVTDIAQAAQWAPNSNYSPGDGGDQGFAQPAAQTGGRSRGFAAGNAGRNFWPYTFTADSFDLDRVDFARGPNAVLFGAGGSGGTTNSATKQANPARAFREVRAQVGSWGRYRLTADINQPINSKLAFRANVLWATGDTWRKDEWEDKTGVHLTGTFRPTPNLSVRAEVEYQKTTRVQGLAILSDNISAWDGKSTPDLNPSLSAANLARMGLARFPEEFVSLPGNRRTLINYQNQFRTKGAQFNANAANTNYINGRPIVTNGFSLSAAPMIDVWDSNQHDRYTAALGGSPFFAVPERSTTSLYRDPDHNSPTYTERGRDMAVYVNYNLGTRLFVEVAADKNGAPRIGDNSQKRGMRDIYIDTNRTLPTGEPNPNFLQPYSDFFPYTSARGDSFENVRASAVYVWDTRIGKLQFGGMAGITEQDYRARSKMVVLPLSYRAPDARALVDTVQQNPWGLYTRNYMNLSDRVYPEGATSTTVRAVDPVTGVISAITPRSVYDTVRADNQVDNVRKYKYLQAAGNWNLFKNHLVLIGAFRRDFSFLSSNAAIATGDNPAGWDGQSVTFKPNAPADYNDLVFSPKDATGKVIGPVTPADTRPRIATLGTNLGAAQYAADRFRDDYNAPSISTNVNTYTLGAVVNPTSWLGLYANRSTTFNLISPSIAADGSLLKPTSSEGKDAGIRITLPNGKLAVSLGWYDAFQAGTMVRVQDGFPEAYNAISDAPVVGDLSPSGRNIRGLIHFPINVWSTVTNKSKGYELEVTANLTPGWRLIVNGGYTDAAQTDALLDVLAYIPKHDAIARQILADSGILINAQNQASINPALNDPTKINQVKVQAAVDGWNNLQNNVIPTIASKTTAKSPVIQTVPWVANVATDYRFQTGKLQGLRLGLGVNYRAGQVVGNRGSDTIPDPNNPALAIDDPAVDALTAVKAPGYYKGTASLSYTVRLKEAGRFAPKSIQFDLNIDNLFDRREPVYAIGAYNSTGSTTTVPRNGDISDPSRKSVPSAYFYMPPRNFTLSARMDF